MSREIKFRAWVPSENAMIQHREVIERAHLQFEDRLDCSDIVMQYTGLKDKNGVEIYEGDILSVCNGSINFTKWMDKPYEVKYILNKGFEMCMFCWSENGESDMDSTHYCEVIGNIHQNPELL